MEKNIFEILMTLTFSGMLISCSDNDGYRTSEERGYKLSPENGFRRMGFGWSISSNEDFLIATTYDREAYLFKIVDGHWIEDHTVLNEGYTLQTDMSDKYIAVSYLSSLVKRTVKVLQNVKGSWKKDMILKHTGSVFEELRGTISISNKHLMVGFSAACPSIIDKSGILIYTKQEKLWKTTAKIESDSCKDYDLKPGVITDNFAFLSYANKDDLNYVSVLRFEDSTWEHKYDFGPYKTIDLLDANEQYLAIGSFEGDSNIMKPKVFIYELYNDSINLNPNIIKDFKENLDGLILYDDKLLVSEIDVPYFFDEEWGTSTVTLYKINGNEYLKIAQYIPDNNDILRFMGSGGWNTDGFGFSIGMNSEYIFIGSPKDDNHAHNQGSVNVLRY